MKISTKKIKLVGSTLLLANIMTGVFAAPASVFTKIDAADYYNLPQVTMTNGDNEVKNSIPLIQLSGGQAQEIYSLVPTQFTGGQDEIISQIPQMTMGSGIAGVEYDDFSFSQTSLDNGVLDTYNSLDLEVISDGVNEEKTDFNGGNNIVMTGGSVATQAMSDGNLQAPTNIDFSAQISYTIDGETNSGFYADLSALLVQFSATKSDYNLMLHSSDLFIATMVNSGELAQDIVVPISITYVDITTGPQTFTNSVTITGGQDEVKSSTTIPVTVGFSEFGDDRTLTIGAANSVFVSDAAKSEQSTSEVATLIATDLNTAYPDYTIVANGANIEFTSDVSTDVTIPVTGSDYSIQTAKAQKLTVEVSGDYIGGTQNSDLQLDEEVFDLTTSPMSASSILTLLESREYSTFEDDINNGKLLLTARTKGDRSSELSPIIDGSFSSQLGVKASTSFTVTQSLSSGAIDKTIEVLGQTVTLGTTGNTATNIASDIATALSSHATYDVTSSGTTVNIVAKNYGVDTTNVFGNDNNYSTVDAVQGSTNPVSIPAGIQIGTTADQTVTINGFDLTIPNAADLTEAQLASELVTLYTAADTNPNGYVLSASGADLILTQKVGMEDLTSTFVDDGDYSTQDKKAATLTVPVPNTISLPNTPDESSLTIDTVTFDLTSSSAYTDGSNDGLSNDEIGQYIADQSFTSYTSTYNAANDELTFTTILEDEDANNLNLATNADLTFVTKNDEWASSTFTVPSPFAGDSTDTLVSTDDMIIIGGVTINFGSAALDEAGVALAIKSSLDANVGFESMYTVTTSGADVNIEKKDPVASTLELNTGTGANNDYTATNEVKSSGMLTITQPIVNDAMDKSVIIATETITFDNAGEDISTMTQTIIDDLVSNPNVRATAGTNPGEIMFNSKKTGTSGNEDIVSVVGDDNRYNGRAQTSTLTMSDLEAGYTYELTINGQTHSDIVTPVAGSEDDVLNMILIKLQLDNTLTSGLASNMFTVTGPVEHDFVFTLTGASNTAPTTSIPTISGNTISGETLTCDYTYSDLESDSELDSNIEWFSNGNSIQSGTSNQYTLTNSESNTMITCEVTPMADYGVKMGMSEISNEVLTAYEVLQLTNNELFSVPYGVDYQRMLSEVSNLELGDDIKEFTDGNWNSIEQDVQGNHMLIPLQGYKFVTSDSQKTISLPVYIDDEYEIQNIYRELDTNFNLVGLNAITQRTTTDFLHNFNYFNAIYDENGDLVFNGIGSPETLDPTKAYWMSVSGVTGETKVFYGVPSGLN